MTNLRTAAQQALEVLEDWDSLVALPAMVALKAALAEPVLQTCNCRWDGEMQMQQCTLHEAHVDAIKEWAQRAKFAEKKLAALAEPGQEPDIPEANCGDMEQVPVGWLENPFGSFRRNWLWKLDPTPQSLAWSIPLYTSPPQRKPLSEEEIERFLSKHERNYDMVKFARAIERAHGIE